MNENPGHRFFAFALTTLAEVQYIECSLNSDQNLKEILPDPMPYSRTASALEQALYYKWGPNEWGRFEYYGQQEHDFFARVQLLLARIESDTRAAATWKESFGARRDYVFEMMISALKVLD